MERLPCQVLSLVSPSVCSLPLSNCVYAVPVCSSDGGIVYEARIEDGKLFYENRWFHKGQHVFVESREHGQERFICL